MPGQSQNSESYGKSGDNSTIETVIIFSKSQTGWRILRHGCKRHTETAYHECHGCDIQSIDCNYFANR